MRGGGQTGTPSRRGARGGGGGLLSFLQLNCQRSETTWTLTFQELAGGDFLADVLLIQDPPLSVATGRTGLPGFRAVIARGSDSVTPQAAIFIRDSLRFRSVPPFGPRVAVAELLGESGTTTTIISAYVRHTSGEGLDDLRRAVTWARGHSPRLVIGMDANGHSPFWGPADIPSNAVGRALEDLILEQNLEVINARDAPRPSYLIGGPSRGSTSPWLHVVPRWD
jgi:hypothetical protein